MSNEVETLQLREYTTIAIPQLNLLELEEIFEYDPSYRKKIKQNPFSYYLH